MFSASRSGVWSEYEIKVSLADFKKDVEKTKIKGYIRGEAVKGDSKHSLLAIGSIRGPSRFWYVVPESLVERVRPLLPVWAGLKAVHDPRCSLVVEVPAPCLHKLKISEKIVAHAKGVCYWRFWNQRRDFAKEVDRHVKRHLGVISPCTPSGCG